MSGDASTPATSPTMIHVKMLTMRSVDVRPRQAQLLCL